MNLKVDANKEHIMKNSHYLFLIPFVFITCNVKSTEQQKTTGVGMNEAFVINPQEFEKNNLSLSVFADDIKYIPLSNSLLIGYAYPFRVTPNAVYLVYDSSGGGEGDGHAELFRFDKNGQNPVQIGRVGNGPQEYLSGNRFAVDEANNRIYISGKINTVLAFDTLGNYIREFKFQNSELRFSKLDILSSNRLFLPQSKLGAKGSYLWYVIDTLGNVISTKSNSTPLFETQTGPQSGTFKYKDKISYWVDYNDTIFEVSPDLTYHASYIIAPDEPRVDESELHHRAGSLLKPSEYYLPRFFLETNKYLINRYSYKGTYAFSFIDKETRKTYTCNYELGQGITGGIVNNFDAGLMFFPLDYFPDGENEYLCAIIQPFELKTHIATDEFKNSTAKYPEKKKELEKLANNLKENDNPVLMLVKLKKE